MTEQNLSDLLKVPVTTQNSNWGRTSSFDVRTISADLASIGVLTDSKTSRANSIVIVKTRQNTGFWWLRSHKTLRTINVRSLQKLMIVSNKSARAAMQDCVWITELNLHGRKLRYRHSNNSFCATRTNEIRFQTLKRPWHGNPAFLPQQCKVAQIFRKRFVLSGIMAKRLATIKLPAKNYSKVICNGRTLFLSPSKRAART